MIKETPNPENISCQNLLIEDIEKIVKNVPNLNSGDNNTQLAIASDNLCGLIKKGIRDERIVYPLDFFLKCIPFHPDSKNKKKKPPTLSLRVDIDYLTRINNPNQNYLKDQIEKVSGKSKPTQFFKIIPNDIVYGRQMLIHTIDGIGVEPDFAISLANFFDKLLPFLDQANQNSTSVV